MDTQELLDLGLTIAAIGAGILLVAIAVGVLKTVGL